MMKVPIFILCLLCLQCTPAFSQTGSLKLHLSILPELKNYLSAEDIVINISICDQPFFSVTLADTLINNLDTGSCIISINATTESRGIAKRFYADYSISIIEDSINILSGVFPEDCNFNKHAFNKICPKCKRSDMVLPIAYGLPIPVYDEKGIIIQKQKNYPGGCTVTNCDPGWHCLRDKTEF
ncbi:MAG TPA: hypothetical protein VHL77_12890 [Ferruginibacter sp.]|jgi:hypothetical protein|nr:hypothetical protein [Ferruginibacter sp.]